MKRTRNLLRLFACVMVFGAVVGMLLPRPAEADCSPCGGAACMFEGFCHPQWTEWCAHNKVWACQYLGGFCPQVVDTHRYCGP